VQWDQKIKCNELEQEEGEGKRGKEEEKRESTDSQRKMRFVLFLVRVYGRNFLLHIFKKHTLNCLITQPAGYILCICKVLK